MWTVIRQCFHAASGVTVNVAFDYKRVAIPERLPAKQAALGFFLENTRFFSAKLSQYLKLPDK
ncbi:hypothetical protein EB444_00575 [Salmonella enterica]|nr:hypothetical protein [Salmonella enterica]